MGRPRMLTTQEPDHRVPAQVVPSGLRDHSPSLWETEHVAVARQLLTSGVRQFATAGFHATTTRDVTSAAGLSPAALYVHFDSKEHLLFEISRIAHQRAVEAITTPVGQDAATHLREVVTRFVTWHARHHVAARVSQYELASLSEEHLQQVLELRRRSTDIVRGAVAQGVWAGAFEELDVHRVARAILSLGVDLVRWYRLDGADSPDRIGACYADLALRMVLPTGAARPDSSESCGSTR